MSTNLNQAIKCCAIIDAYDETAENDKKILKNDLFTEMINCTYRDLILSISRVYDESKDCKNNVEELKSYIKKEEEYAISKKEKNKIIDMLKSLQKEYNDFYKHDRNKRLAHSDYKYIFDCKEINDKYTYQQIKKFVIKTKEAFEYILYINNSHILCDDIDYLKDKYKAQFNY